MGNYLCKNKKYYTREEVAKHNTSYNCWVICNNKVYDITPFIIKHPGPSDLLTNNAGQDCSIHYNFHGKNAKKLWSSLQIGFISKTG